ncbi:MAG: arsenic resistance N-acetyltransferase ArsN2 [Pseudomonadota bacterium]
MTIQPACPEDFNDIHDLLASNALPTDDIRGAALEFLVMRDSLGLVACGALERLGECCLLRSIAVAPRLRSRGLAAALTKALLRSDTRGSRDVFLLTNDADGYFAGHGFVVASRESAPDVIRRSNQFANLCPDSAILMRYSR